MYTTFKLTYIMPTNLILAKMKLDEILQNNQPIKIPKKKKKNPKYLIKKIEFDQKMVQAMNLLELGY